MKTCLKMICSPWQRLVQIQNLVNHEYLFVQQIYLHVLHLMWLSCYQGLGLKYLHVLHPVPSPCSHQRFYSIIFSRLEIVGVHQCFTKHAYLLFFKFIWNALPEQSYLLHFSYYHTSSTKSTCACVNCFYCLWCKIKIVVLSYWFGDYQGGCPKTQGGSPKNGTAALLK